MPTIESTTPRAMIATLNQTVFDLNTETPKMKSYFEFYETDAEANPKTEKRRIEFSDIAVTLSLRYPGPVRQLRHFIQLACSAPGHPVDVTHWQEGALVYSARIVYHANNEKHSVIFA
jgi:hypothetical protein